MIDDYCSLCPKNRSVLPLTNIFYDLKIEGMLLTMIQQIYCQADQLARRKISFSFDFQTLYIDSKKYRLSKIYQNIIECLQLTSCILFIVIGLFSIFLHLLNHYYSSFRPSVYSTLKIILKYQHPCGE